MDEDLFGLPRIATISRLPTQYERKNFSSQIRVAAALLQCVFYVCQSIDKCIIVMVCRIKRSAVVVIIWVGSYSKSSSLVTEETELELHPQLLGGRPETSVPPDNTILAKTLLHPQWEIEPSNKNLVPLVRNTAGQ